MDKTVKTDPLQSLIKAEMDALYPPRPMSRRSFLATSLATGFAAAVLPVSAQTIHTDSAGLTAGMVKIKTKQGSIPAYRAMPAGQRKLPVVLVVQEIFGVHEHIKDVCRRLAKEGYMAIAPELYFRQGNPMKYTEVPTLMKEVVSKVPDEQVFADLDASLAWAKRQGADVKNAAITGFCWGGRIVWLYSARRPDLKAGVAWYGRLVGEPSELNPHHPVDKAAELKVPVLGLYGGKDQGIPVETVEKMREALTQGGSEAQASKIMVYPNAPHAFNADYRPSYSKEDADDAWKQMLAWFKQHGVGGSEGNPK